MLRALKQVLSPCFLVLLLASVAAADLSYGDFSSVNGLRLNGSATQFGDRVRLTPSAYNRRGSAWYLTKQSVRGGFYSIFAFQVTQRQHSGADGLAFVVQNASDDALGAKGGGIGYAQIPNSLAIEFDTYYNENIGDPNGNHISVQTNGTGENGAGIDYSLGYTTNIPTLEDGSIYLVLVKYVPGHLSVFLDDFSAPVLEVDVDLASTLQLDSDRAWVGFTAATGAAYEVHDLLSWRFETADAHVWLGAQILAMAKVRVELLNSQGEPLDPPILTETNAEGVYDFPYVPAGEYRARAFVKYVEPASEDSIVVINYPNWNPKATFHLGGPDPDPLPDIVFPEPVILQAGLNGGLSTWDALQPYLEKDPAEQDKGEGVPGFLCFPMPSNDENPTEGYENGSWLVGIGVEDHDANALKLSQWIENHVKTSGMLGQWLSAEDLNRVPFSFVCHSMGGLIVRSLVTGRISPPVQRIVSMDGVHGGTDTAWPLDPGLAEGPLNGYAVGLGCPPTITESGWNASHTDLRHTWLLYACVPDWIVFPDRSAYGYGRQITYDPEVGFEPLDCDIRWMNGLTQEVGDSHRGEGAIHHNPVRLRETALFLARGQTPSGGIGGAPATQGPPEGLGYVAGALQASAGGTATQTVLFDANTLVYGEVSLLGASAQYGLFGPDGNPVDLTITDSQGEGDSLTEMFEITFPPIGEVTVQVFAGPSSEASLGFRLRFDNGRKLVAEADPVMLAAGSPVQLTAELVDDLGTVLVGASPDFSATIHLPDGTAQGLTLFDDGLHGDGGPGDGTFGNTFADTLQEGRYFAECTGLLDLGAEWAERTETAAFAVIPTGGTLSGLPVESTPDADQDGFYDSLNLDQTITFTRNGNFRIAGPLLDAAGELVAQVSEEYENTQGAGAATVTLVVSAREIVLHGVNGPWTLSGLTLYDLDAGSLPSSVAADYVTQAYDIGSFEPPAPPKISWVIPSEGPFAGGNEVVIGGSGLDVTSRVLVGESEASFTVTDDSSLLVIVPPLESGPSKPPRRGTALSERRAVPVTVITPWATVVAPGAYTYSRRQW